MLTPANACVEERPLLAEVCVATISVESDSSDCFSRVKDGLNYRTQHDFDPHESTVQHHPSQNLLDPASKHSGLQRLDILGLFEDEATETYAIVQY